MALVLESIPNTISTRSNMSAKEETAAAAEEAKVCIAQGTCSRQLFTAIADFIACFAAHRHPGVRC